MDTKIYNGVELTPKECDALEDIENISLKGKAVPRHDIPGYMSTGIVVEDNHVVQMSFEENDLKTLPESFGNFKWLKHISIMGGQLSRLPKSIGNLQLLETIFFTEVPLKTIPESIGNLKSLTTLYLIGSKLTTLPESLANLTSLQKLNITGAPLSGKPETTEKILKKLEESGCSISK